MPHSCNSLTFFAGDSLEIHLATVAAGPGVGGETLAPVLAWVPVVTGVHSARANTLKRKRKQRLNAIHFFAFLGCNIIYFLHFFFPDLNAKLFSLFHK